MLQQGAKVAESAFVDTLDVVDFDSLEIGEKAAVGEGTTVLGHTFDKNGDLVFNKVSFHNIMSAAKSPINQFAWDFSQRHFLHTSCIFDIFCLLAC